MKPLRIFCNESLKLNNMIKLDNSNYIINVMNRKIGDKIVLINGKDGEFCSEIVEINKKYIVVKIVDKFRDFKNSEFLGLIFTPIQKIDLLVKNAVELGITNFIPFVAQYTQYSNKLNRINGNIIEAVEQCERLDLPIVEKQQKLMHILDNLSTQENIILFCEERSRVSTTALSILQNIDKTKRLYVLIGGEGGFSEEEKILIKKYKNVLPISLGERILRTETAVSAVLACVNLFRNS